MKHGKFSHSNVFIVSICRRTIGKYPERRSYLIIRDAFESEGENKQQDILAALQNNPSSALDGRTPCLFQYSRSAQALSQPENSHAAAAAALRLPPPSTVTWLDGGSTTSRPMMHYRRQIVQASPKWKEKENKKVMEYHCWKNKKTTT